MFNLPYETKYPGVSPALLSGFSRMSNIPLDTASVFTSYTELEAYVTDTNTTAYPGQYIVVLNDSIDPVDSAVTHAIDVYVLTSTLAPQLISANPIFESIADATTYVSTNTSHIHPGQLITVLNDTSYDIYSISPDKSLKKMNSDDAGSETTWSNITNTPTTLSGYGITDAVTLSYVVNVAEANKILILNADGKLPADITGDAQTLNGKADSAFALAAHTHGSNDIASVDAATIVGVLSIDNIPKAALERCITVEDDTARFALTSDDIQTGDTVKVTSTDRMYFVKDIASLSTEDGYMPYSAGSAASVPWTGVTNTPTTIAGYGITDALSESYFVSVAAPNVVLKLNDDGKLPADITGDAQTLNGKADTAFASAIHTHTATDVGAVSTDDVVNAPTANKILKLNADGKFGADITGDAQTLNGKADTDFAATSHTHGSDDITSIEWTKMIGTPTTIAGYGITDVLGSGDVVTVAEANKILRLNADSKLPADITGDAQTLNGKADSAFAEASHTHTSEDIIQLSWAKVANAPTTIAGYGITDAINTDTMSETPSAGKIPVYNDNAKLPADITGDAQTLNGKADTDFATASHTHDMGDITSLTAELANIKNGSSITSVNASAISGTINIENLPAGALERCVTVENDTARFALTSDDIQTGDTVKVESSGNMFFVKDITNLANENGYTPYTSGAATSVPWSGVTGKPDFGTGAGEFAEGNHTHTAESIGAVASTDVVTTAEPNKILKINASGKMDCDITGSAPWDNLTDGPNASGELIDEAVENAAHTNRTTLDKITESGNVMKFDNSNIATEQYAVNTVQFGSVEPSNLPVGGIWYETVTLN